ncbi:MAG: tetratricopeptide repeat protein [Candidatus Omnitrophota bacterium]
MNKLKKPKILFLLFIAFFFVQSGSAADLNKKEEDAFYVAAKAYEDGFYDTALNLFDRFVKTYMDSDRRLEAQVYVGQCYFAQEKYIKALDQFESLLKMPEAEPLRDKIYFWLGEVYAKGRAYSQAEDFYQQLISRYKNSSYCLAATKSLAQTQLSDQKFQEAAATYRSLLSETKDLAVAEEAWLGICEALYRLRDYTQLQKEIENFISTYPDSGQVARAYLFLAEANFYLGRFDEAIKAYQEAQRQSREEEQTAQAKIGLGWSWLKLKNYPEAQKIFDEFPDETSLAVLLGRAVLKSGLGEYEQSLPFFDRVIEAQKGAEYAPLAYFGKAEVLYHLERFEEAITAYRVAMDALKAASSLYADTRELTDRIRYGLAWAYLKIGDFRSAQEEFQRVATLTQDKIFKISAMCQIGDVYQDAGDYKKALETYQSFLKEYPDTVYHDYVQYQIGVTFLKMSDLDAAILAFRQLLKDSPSTKLADDANYFLGIVYFQKGDFAAAKMQFGKFLDHFKDSPYRPQAVFLLGESLMNLSEFKAALEAFEAVRKEFADQETLRQKAEYEIANAFAQMGQEAEANKRLADFITRYPDSQLSPDILFWLGEHFRNKKDFLNAQKYFERLIRNYPHHETRGDAFLEMGLMNLKEEKTDAALRNFQQAAEAGRGETESRALLFCGDVYVLKGDFPQALDQYRRLAEERSVWSKTALVKMASVLRQQKRFKDAAAAYEQALSREGSGEGSEENAAIQFQLAQMFEEEGLLQEALEAYMKTSYLYPNETSWVVKALFHVAQIYEQKEAWAESRAILEKIAGMPVSEAKYAKEKLATIPVK